MMKRISAAFAVLLLNALEEAICFIPTYKRVCNLAPAFLWSPQSEEESSSSLHDFSSDSYLSAATTPLHHSFGDYVSQLARLAVAFSAYPLKLKDVEHVEILGIDSTHMDVQAVVCEDDGCVTLMVPLEFPHPCDKVEEECVIDNIQLLDRQAEAETKLDSELEHLLQDKLFLDGPVDLPEWWVVPEYSIAESCNDLVKLLDREDYVSDVKALATFTSKQFVKKARVLAVGPAGIHLLASVGDEEPFQISFPFDSPHHEIEQLQMAIVNAFTMAVSAVDLKP